MKMEATLKLFLMIMVISFFVASRDWLMNGGIHFKWDVGRVETIETLFSQSILYIKCLLN